jgi:hypothetical protein
MQPPVDLLADRLDQEPAIADHQAGTVQDGQRTAMPAPQQTEETKVRDGQQRQEQPPRPPIPGVQHRCHGEQRHALASQQHQRQPRHHTGAARPRQLHV